MPLQTHTCLFTAMADSCSSSSEEVHAILLSALAVLQQIYDEEKKEVQLSAVISLVVYSESLVRVPPTSDPDIHDTNTMVSSESLVRVSRTCITTYRSRDLSTEMQPSCTSNVFCNCSCSHKRYARGRILMLMATSSSGAHTFLLSSPTPSQLVIDGSTGSGSSFYPRFDHPGRLLS